MLRLLLVCALVAPAYAQTPSTLQHTAQQLSERANPADVTTLDGIIDAFYATVSGPAGQPRQWRRDSTLYYPGHRFISTGMRDGAATLAVMPHGVFAALTDSLLTPTGFFEREVKRVTSRFGHVTHVWSTYAWSTQAEGPAMGYGVNSIQLLWDGQRWWITSTAWDSARPDQPLPPAFSPDVR